MLFRTVHWDEHVDERSALPNDLIPNVTGQVALDEMKPRIYPVASFPDPSVAAVSQRLLHKHSTEFPGELILMQVSL